MVEKISIRTILRVVLLFSILLGADALHAQWPSRFDRPDLYVMLGDSLWLCRVTHRGRDTVDPDEFTQTYIFRMYNDSTSLTEYKFGETRRNGHRIELDKWSYNSTRTTASAVLSYNSRTMRFPIHGGDTLSFYRELYWYNPLMNRQLSNEYRSLDTLTYAVELVRPSTETRLALLDSIGIMPNPTPATPVVHGSRPIMAKVEYVVPSSFGTDTVIMRVIVRDRGEGDYWFDRSDQVAISLSKAILQPQWQQYLAAWGLLLWGPQVAKSDLGQATAPGNSAMLNIAVVPGTRDTRITFSTSPNGAPTSVVIYDALGRAVFYPYSSRAVAPTVETYYRAEQSGIYFVGLIHDGRLVRTEKINIAR
jgi:hypothetical protein